MDDRYLLDTLMEQTADQVYFKDDTSRFVRISRGLANRLGLDDPAEAIGKTDFDFFSGEHADAAFADEQRLMQTGESLIGIEERETWTDGREAWVSTTKVPLREPDGQVIGLFGISRDITERRLTAKHLAQAQKMEAVGQLAGGIAHDFNNILTAIDGYAEFALRDLDKPDLDINRLRDEITAIKQAGERAADLTRQLLAYSRQRGMQRQVVDLNTIVERSGRLLSRLIGEDITVELLTDSDLPSIEADAAQLEQVIVNLAVNARDAMPDGGTLTIRTAHASLIDQSATRLGLASGDYLLLSVQDTGVGIAEGLKDQIFEPFFTTKPLGYGTGLGLATVYSIVSQTGGAVALDSELGAGSRFEVYLPASTRPAIPTELPLAHANQGSERILLVEDEDVLRGLISEMLTAKGYDVVVAADPAAALDCARDNSFELVITDVLLPIMNGAALVNALRDLQPSLGVLFISGYASTIIDDKALGRRTRFLPKPFTAEDIASAARDILDAN